MSITIHWWMLPFAAVPTAMLLACFAPNGSLFADDIKATAGVTTVAWILMGFARWLP